MERENTKSLSIVTEQKTQSTVSSQNYGNVVDPDYVPNMEPTLEGLMDFEMQGAIKKFNAGFPKNIIGTYGGRFSSDWSCG